MSCSISRIESPRSVAQPLHQLAQLLGLLRVHPGRRLVEQQQLGVGRQRTRDLEAALIAVGQVHRQLAVALEPDEVQQLAPLLDRAFSSRLHERRVQDHAREARAHARVHPHLDVLERGHRAEQLDVLERARDAGLGDEVGALGGDVLAVERRRVRCVGLYSPVMQLKNVVLPAPLGPISETMRLVRDD